MPNHRDALVPPPPQDEARKRWTRPVIHELDCVQTTESGQSNGLFESAIYFDQNAASS